MPIPSCVRKADLDASVTYVCTYYVHISVKSILSEELHTHGKGRSARTRKRDDPIG